MNSNSITTLANDCRHRSAGSCSTVQSSCPPTCRVDEIHLRASIKSAFDKTFGATLGDDTSTIRHQRGLHKLRIRFIYDKQTPYQTLTSKRTRIGHFDFSTMPFSCILQLLQAAKSENRGQIPTWWEQDHFHRFGRRHL